MELEQLERINKRLHSPESQFFSCCSTRARVPSPSEDHNNGSERGLELPRMMSGASSEGSNETETKAEDQDHQGDFFTQPHEETGQFTHDNPMREERRERSQGPGVWLGSDSAAHAEQRERSPGPGIWLGLHSEKEDLINEILKAQKRKQDQQRANASGSNLLLSLSLVLLLVVMLLLMLLFLLPPLQLLW